MKKHNTRPDDFEKRRAHLKNKSDAELKTIFWDLADKATKPLVDLAYKNTSPSIERSILLRMGFSSLEAGALVEKIIEHEFMGKGAGGVVYRLSILKNISVREAGLLLLEDKEWPLVKESYGVK